MEPRYYTYISPTKVNLLYNQTRNDVMSEIETGVSGTIGIFSGKISAKRVGSKNICQKMEYVLKELKHEHKTGRITKSFAPFIVEKNRLSMSFAENVVFWRGSWVDESNRTCYRLLMYGSLQNVIGFNKDSRCPGGSLMSYALDVLAKAHNLGLDKSRDLNKVSSLKSHYSPEAYKRHIDRKYIDYLDNRWMLVEAMFAHDLFDPLDRDNNSIQRIFARVDYRETVTYEEYCKKKHYIYGSPHWYPYNLQYPLPEETDYIVYIYASPIFVEDLPRSNKIHVINNKRYLYIPKKKIKAIIESSGESEWIIDDIVRLLIQNGLNEEAESLQADWLHLFWEHSSIQTEDIMPLLYRYITTVEPL